MGATAEVEDWTGSWSVQHRADVETHTSWVCQWSGKFCINTMVLLCC